MKLCQKCNKPVVFTFAKAYTEYGCVECDIWGEYLGSGFKKVPDTPLLLKEQAERKKKWSNDLTYIGIRFGGMYCSKTNKRVLDCSCKNCIKIRKIKPKYWKISKEILDG